MASIIQRGKKWRAYIRSGGRSVSASFDTKTEAKRWATNQEAEIQRQQSSGAGLVAGKTLADALRRYMVEVSPTKKGERWEVIRLTAFLSDSALLFRVPLAKLSTTMLAEWRDERLTQVSAATVNRELNLISAVLAKARSEWRWLAHKPLEDLKRPRNPPPRDRRISDEERDRLVKQLGYTGEPVTTKSGEVAIAFLLALETAMRRGELLGLVWERVNLDRRTVALDDTKNGTRREVPLSDRALALFRLLPAKTAGRCFSVSLETLDATFRRAVRRAEIEGLHFHDTRHEALTRLAARLTVIELARMVGHRDLKSLMIYYNATAEELARKL